MRSTLVFLLTCGVSTVVAFAILMLIFMRFWGLAPVEGQPSDSFPVLLVEPGPSCSVVHWSELAAAKERVEAWSYLVPVSDLAECKSQLRPDASLKIRAGEAGRHELRVATSPGGDEVDTARYWATAETIEPISQQRFFGPLVALVAAAAAALLGLVVGVLALRLARGRRA